MNPVSLPGGNAQLHKYKRCKKCDQDRPPEGGIEMSPTRWLCVNCWHKRITKEKA